MAAVLIGYFVFLFRASDKEYRDVIAEKFNEKSIIRSGGKLMWFTLSYAAWGVSAALVLWMLFDWFKVDTTYSEEVLTSSREGELEAIAEEHRV